MELEVGALMLVRVNTNQLVWVLLNETRESFNIMVVHKETVLFNDSNIQCKIYWLVTVLFYK